MMNNKFRRYEVYAGLSDSGILIDNSLPYKYQEYVQEKVQMSNGQTAVFMALCDDDGPVEASLWEAEEMRSALLTLDVADSD